MFSIDMIEKRVNEGEIDDIDKDVFQEFLNLIYTGKWTQIKLMAGRLLLRGRHYFCVLRNNNKKFL